MFRIKFCYFLFFIICFCLIFLGIHSTAEHEDSRVVWVPVMERRNEMSAAIGDALKSETEKTQRISKMLNKSISTQEEEVAQGSKKLHVLQKSSSSNTKHSSSHSTNSAKAFKTLIFLPFCLLNFGQIFIKALI
jgi:predicted PurR-regulated permease PerM